jgi:hypothetical protein
MALDLWGRATATDHITTNYQEITMKKIIFALAALTALSTASFAERSWDLRDSPEAQGSFSTPADRAVSNDKVFIDVAPLASVASDNSGLNMNDLPNDIYDAHGFRR